MNSKTTAQRKLPMKSRWMTADGSPWWLRSTTYTPEKAPADGEYRANCYLDLTMESGAAEVTFKDSKCDYHSKSYYCQPVRQSLTPTGDMTELPACTCKKIALVGEYSAGTVIKCTKCKDVYKSTEENSCPDGTKIFA